MIESQTVTTAVERATRCLHGQETVLKEDVAIILQALGKRTKGLVEIARIRTELHGDFSLSSKQSEIARKALTSGDQT